MSTAASELTPKERLGRGLETLGRGMAPMVDARMGEAAAGREWVSLYEAAEAARRGRPHQLDRHDPRALLRIVRHERAVFTLDQSQRAWADELIHAGNRWAHAMDVTSAEVHRAFDTMALLADSLDLASTAADLRAMADPAGVSRAADDHGLSAPLEAGDASRQAVARETAQTRPLDPDVPPGFTVLKVEIGQLDVVVALREALNYALVSNRISPVVAVLLRNHGDEPVDPGTVTISIEPWDRSAVTEPLVIEPGPVAAGGTPMTIPTNQTAWQLSPAAFVGLDESVTTQVTLVAGAGEDARQARSLVRLLPPDEWWARTLPEALAAHIRPNDASVLTLLGEASALLQERTGSGSLEGYQSGEERVAHIATALFDAMKAREIRYVDPPPSFEGTGQRIRSHGEVLEGRWGTCLDLATTYAAALEAAGLNPVITLTKNHAFAGVLMADEQLAQLVLDDDDAITTVMDAGLVEMVETTALTQGRDDDFTSAGNLTAQWWTRRLGEVKHLLDVRSAHRRVRPLPGVRRNGDTVVVEVEVEHVERRRRAVGQVATTARANEELPPRVDKWLRSLLDLSLRNPLLRLSPTAVGVAPVHVPKGALGALEDLVAGGQEVTLLPHDDLSALHIQQGARSAQDVDAGVLRNILIEEARAYVALPTTSYDSRLRGLARRAKTALEETGANNLYLALGTLSWPDRSKEVRAPLFLLPVKLTGRRGAPWTLRVDEGGVALPNHCLVEKLRVSLGMNIPELLDPGTDDAGIDIERALTAVRAAIMSSGVTGMRVEETATLAMLQFSSLEMWKDLGNNWQHFINRPVVRHLVETPGVTFIDPVPAPEPDPSAEATTFLPVAADGSQIEAVRWATAGRSFVLEGPPGTGKSQTITNLIADCLAHGKRVLFVAEKQAALDVVQRRLEDVGLGVFSLDLHGRSQTITSVRSQLSAAIEHGPSGTAAWEPLRDRFVSLTRRLSRYPRQLHDKGAAEHSAWSARQLVLALREQTGLDADGLPRVPSGIARGTVPAAAVHEAARELTEALEDLGSPISAFPWRIAGLTDEDALDPGRIVATTGSLLAAEGALAGSALRALVGLADGPDALATIGAWSLSGADGVLLSPAEARQTVTPGWVEHARQVRVAVERFRAESMPRLGPFTPDVLRLDLDAALAESRVADSKMFGKRKRRAAIVSQLSAGVRDIANVELKTLTHALTSVISVREAAKPLAVYVNGLPGVSLPFGWNPVDEASAVALEARIHGWEAAARLATMADPSRLDPAAELAATSLSKEASEAGRRVMEFAATWRDFEAELHTQPSDRSLWQGSASLFERVAEDRSFWERDCGAGALVGLRRWTRVRRALAAFDAWDMTDVGDQLRAGALAVGQIEDVVRLAVAEAVLEERLEESGLRAFDERQQARITQDFIRTGADVREQMRQELPAQIVAARTFDARSRAGRSADFMAQVTRRRGGATIRQLLRDYGSIVTEVTPCLLMSPHSVARFLPADMTFDVVVFDEASQIRVAESIGALGRGAAVVVVGDSKQMPPSSSFAAGFKEPEEENAPESVTVVADGESILEEAVESRLPTLALTWHYRSRDESLIAFSNSAYYDSRLASFPSPPEQRDHLGVSWRRVDGVWEGGAKAARINRTEAEAVVAEIKKLLSADPDRSIGVVTFNLQQRDLILDLVERSTDARLQAALERPEEPLFVKNLENVQGDERDVILFTLAFARVPGGKVPLNWGPLTQAGGEKRLNVAVTRAKEQVIVFSSFDPEELDLSTSTSTGLAHLRDYLLLAKHGPERAGLARARKRDWHLEEVADELRAAGLEVRTHVGLSDFTVDLAVRAATDRPWVAVLLDGPSWSERSTVNDREALPSTVLQHAMGWPQVVRLWLPTWLRDREAAVAEIVQAASACEPNGSQSSVVGDAEPQDSGVDTLGFELVSTDDEVLVPLVRSSASTSESRVVQRVGDGVPFVAAADAVIGDVSVLDNAGVRSYRAQVQREIDDVLRTEGPVLASRCARIIARRYGLDRLRASRLESIVAMIPPARVRRSANGELVAWHESQVPDAWTEYRVPGDVRDLGDIPYEEIRNAYVAIARSAHGMGREDLLKETAREFGIGRLASKVRPRLEGALRAALEEDALKERAGMVDAV